jgi:PAS domain-containing protein
MNEVISFWNRGAEQLYGWNKDEALGHVAHELLRTIFPAPLEEASLKTLDGEPGMNTKGRATGQASHSR